MFNKVAKAKKIVIMTVLGTGSIIALLVPQFVALAGKSIGGV
jgi:hypothetical protein